jgi:hypothetical protein
VSELQNWTHVLDLSQPKRSGGDSVLDLTLPKWSGSDKGTRLALPKPSGSDNGLYLSLPKVYGSDNGLDLSLLQRFGSLASDWSCPYQVVTTHHLKFHHRSDPVVTLGSICHYRDGKKV